MLTESDIIKALSEGINMLFNVSLIILFPLLGAWILVKATRQTMKVRDVAALAILLTVTIGNAVNWFMRGKSVIGHVNRNPRFYALHIGIALVAVLASYLIIRMMKKNNYTIRIYRFYTASILSILLFMIIYILWILSTMGTLTFDIVLNNLISPINTQTGTFVNDIVGLGSNFAAIFFGFFTIAYSKDLVTPIRWKSRRSTPLWVRFTNRMSVAIIAVLVVSLSFQALYVPQIISYALSNDAFFEDHYVNPQDANLQFPEKKRNLIYIFVESLETTYLDKERGGNHDVNMIPNLTRYLEGGAVNFSNTDAPYGGIQNVPGATWSIAGMSTQMSGIPYKKPPGEREDGYVESFLPGMVNLGDILHEQGYRQRLIAGANASFYGIRSFYEQHGNYEIYDWGKVKEVGWLDKDYLEWWGFEDRKLFDMAKMSLNEFSQSDQPFNLVLETNDLHFPDGYTDSACEKPFGQPYANAISCNDAAIGEFLDWVVQQDFYENTTVIINGDHLSMDATYFQTLDQSYDRTTFSMYLNPAWDKALPQATLKNRTYSALDVLPTVLSALGVSFDGSQLGIGVDLSSGKQTLSEKYTIEYLRKVMEMRSEFYESNILTVSSDEN